MASPAKALEKANEAKTLRGWGGSGYEKEI